MRARRSSAGGRSRAASARARCGTMRREHRRQPLATCPAEPNCSSRASVPSGSDPLYLHLRATPACSLSRSDHTRGWGALQRGSGPPTPPSDFFHVDRWAALPHAPSRTSTRCAPLWPTQPARLEVAPASSEVRAGASAIATPLAVALIRPAPASRGERDQAEERRPLRRRRRSPASRRPNSRDAAPARLAPCGRVPRV